MPGTRNATRTSLLAASLLFLAGALPLLSSTPAAQAQGLATARTPAEAGMSAERLKRLSAVLQARVDSGEIPGAVALVARKGRIVYHEAFGFRDRESQSPMRTDAIFRMASMTKPVTSLAIMMLAEEGRLHIADPVSRHIPEFKDMKVGVEKPDGTGKTTLVLEPAAREMTLQDLLRHTSGLTYAIFGRSAVKSAWREADPTNRSQTNAQMAAKLAKLPLQYHPGSTWEYGMSTDLLARVVEVVSGMDFDRFVEERIARPLRMADTGFWVSAERHGRIAQPQVNRATGKPDPMPDVTSRPNWISGGGGMVSTSADYARFCQMLLNGGELDGVRLVSRKTLQFMTANHLPPGVRPGPTTAPSPWTPWPDSGLGFGLGFAVRLADGVAQMPGTAGDYSWAGLYGTYFWIDPKEDLFAVFMMQATALRNPYRLIMRELVYQALEK